MAEGFAALPGQSSHETCGPPMVIFQFHPAPVGEGSEWCLEDLYSIY